MGNKNRRKKKTKIQIGTKKKKCKKTIYHNVFYNKRHKLWSGEVSSDTKEKRSSFVKAQSKITALDCALKLNYKCFEENLELPNPNLGAWNGPITVKCLIKNTKKQLLKLICLIVMI